MRIALLLFIEANEDVFLCSPVVCKARTEQVMCAHLCYLGSSGLCFLYRYFAGVSGQDKEDLGMINKNVWKY